MARAACAKGLWPEGMWPSPGTERRPRDEDAQNRARSRGGKIAGAGGGLVLILGGWIKDLGFSFQGNGAH